MRLQHLQYLACPQCASPLALADGQATTDGRVETGTLACGAAGHQFPILRWIPRFVPLENYAEGFGFQWQTHSRTQYDAANGAAISETRFFEATRWPRRMEGELLLEAGSGAGRFTEHAAATGAMVCTLDYSAAVEANYASNGHRENVLIVQGDIYAMPFPKGTFHRVLCFGVLQHTPDVERAFKALPPMLRPGGSLAIDVYRKPRGLQRLTNTKYYVRPITKRVAPQRLYRLTSAYVRGMWPVARVLRRIPYFGIRLNWALLIPDYGLTYDIPDERLREWAVLDAFDALAPAYDTPQDLSTVRRWLQEAGLEDWEAHYGYNGIEGRGRRPTVLADATDRPRSASRAGDASTATDARRPSGSRASIVPPGAPPR